MVLLLYSDRPSECSLFWEKIIGNYIVDFFCPKANLIIELDGGQHYSEEGLKKDKKIDNFEIVNVGTLRAGIYIINIQIISIAYIIFHISA